MEGAYTESRSRWAIPVSCLPSNQLIMPSRIPAEGPETTNILIFAQLTTNPQSESLYSPPQITLQVGRIITVPPSLTDSRSRVPRPDDPTPRVPPPFYATLNQCSSEILGTFTKNRRTRKDPVDDDSIRRAGAFKVPPLPRPHNALSLDGAEHELEKANKLVRLFVLYVNFVFSQPPRSDDAGIDHQKLHSSFPLVTQDFQRPCGIQRSVRFRVSRGHFCFGASPFSNEMDCVLTGQDASANQVKNGSH
jgi:hypothetical protein